MAKTNVERQKAFRQKNKKTIKTKIKTKIACGEGYSDTEKMKRRIRASLWRQKKRIENTASTTIVEPYGNSRTASKAINRYFTDHIVSA